MMSVAVSKVGVVLCRLSSQSQWTILVGYRTISTNVNCYQTRYQRQYNLPFSNKVHTCTSAWCVQHSSTAADKSSLNFISPELWPQKAKAELN